MINNIRYIERTVSENFGDSIKDLEDTNYWELLAILSAKGDKDSSQSQQRNNRSDRMNAYQFFKHHTI